jgi:hypothetical protein
MPVRFISLFFAVFFLFQAQNAHAAKRFDVEYRTISVQETTAKGTAGEALFLGRRIKIYNFILPYAAIDEGYVLFGVVGSEYKIYPLDEIKIKAMQAKHVLPDPLPPFDLKTMDYIEWHSLWLALVPAVFFVGWVITGRWGRSILNAIHAARGARRAILDPDVADMLKRIRKLSRIPSTSNAPELARVKARTGYSEHTLWLLALDGALVTGYSGDPFSLDGGMSTEEDKEKQRKALVEWWGVRNRKDLIDMLASISRGMHSHEYNDYVKIWHGDDDVLKENMRKDKKTRKNLQIVGGVIDIVGDRSLLAWDYGRGVMLSTTGYAVGYLSEEEMWRYVKHFGAEIGKRYNSWKDYGLNYLIGRIIWADDKASYFEGTEQALQWLLSGEGVWSAAPWPGAGNGQPVKPRIYKTGTGRLLLFLLFGAMLLAGGLMGVWLFEAFPETGSEEQRFLYAAISSLFALAGAWVALFALRYRLILRPDEIEVSSFLYKRTLLRNNIAGKRVRTVQGARAVMLEPKDKRSKKLHFSGSLNTDDVFEQWLETIHDLDALELEQSVKDAAQNPAFGKTEEDRAAYVRRARRIAVVLNVAASVVGVIAIADLADLLLGAIPNASLWLIASVAALPPLAVVIVVMSKGLYILDVKDFGKSALPNVFGLFGLPAIALAVRAWLDIDVLDVQFALKIMGVAGAAAALAVLPAAKTRDARVLAVIFAVVWSSGAVLYYNALFDKSAPAAFQPRVMEKTMVPGKTNDYYLVLEPWGHQAKPEKVHVTRELYRAASVKSPVCVLLYPGALDIRWFKISPCR